MISAESFALDAHLATITSQEEQDFIATLVTDPAAAPVWIKPTTNGLGPWLGGFQDNGDPNSDPGGPAANWTWITGEIWAFTNWALGEPSNLDGIEDHLHFTAPNAGIGSLWNDAPSDIPQLIFGYVVEYVAPPCCLGNATKELVGGEVNFGDVTAVIANWLTVYPFGSGPGDADCNGVVNFADITTVLSSWLSACS